MSASASDIITYIGVPLAVLGVLPIIYTCLRAVLVLRSIRKALAQNGHSDSAVTRGSMMSGIVEVELPRCTITPLDRDYDAEYWKLNLDQSSLKGGSWTSFHWNRLVTGKKLYRIQYKDELRVPQAEIGFDELIGFLLDRGAVPEENGWNTLRASGLWTPTGTVLLKTPLSGLEAVLRVDTPNDSDGMLSLRVHWKSGWDWRDKHCLPPFWVRIRQPLFQVDAEIPEKGMVEEQKTKDLISTSLTEAEDASEMESDDTTTDAEPTERETLQGQDSPDSQDESSCVKVPLLLAEIEQKRGSLHGSQNPSNSIRFRLEAGAVGKIHYENNNALTSSSRNIGHTGDVINQWFVYTASSLEQNENPGACSFVLPPNILQGVQKDAVPCGTMELLDIMRQDEVPRWVNPRPARGGPMRLHQRYVENQRQMQVEKTMPPAQAEAARRARESAHLTALRDDHIEDMRLQREYEEKRVGEALNSPRLSNQTIVTSCVRWLIAHDAIPKEYQITDIARAVLYLMVLDHSQAKSIVEVCDRWMHWSQAGGMNRTEFEFLQEHTAQFCYASALIHIIQAAAQSESKISTDMQECLKVWKRVRLG